MILVFLASTTSSKTTVLFKHEVPLPTGMGAQLLCAIVNAEQTTVRAVYSFRNHKYTWNTSTKSWRTLRSAIISVAKIENEFLKRQRTQRQRKSCVVDASHVHVTPDWWIVVVVLQNNRRLPRFVTTPLLHVQRDLSMTAAHPATPSILWMNPCRSLLASRQQNASESRQTYPSQRPDQDVLH